jgi:TctA family transporter
MENKSNELMPIYVWSLGILSAICAGIVYVYSNKEAVGFVSRLTEPSSMLVLAVSIVSGIGAYALNKTK